MFEDGVVRRGVVYVALQELLVLLVPLVLVVLVVLVVTSIFSNLVRLQTCPNCGHFLFCQAVWWSGWAGVPSSDQTLSLPAPTSTI